MNNSKSPSFIPQNLQSMNSQKLLDYYDNPRNFKVKDCRNEKWDNFDKKFPSHSLIFLTHGSYAVNEQIRRTTDLTKTQFLRLIKNYSDHGTRKMIKKSEIPNENVICFPGTRAIGDPNREYKTQNEDDKSVIGRKFIRDTDFNGQKIITNPGQFRSIGKEKTNKYNYNLNNTLNLTEQNYGGSIGYDIHCTGNTLMDKNPNLDKFRPEGFPEMTLGTKDGESCNQEILDFFAKRLNNYLGLKIYINKPFQGGYITTRHGMEKRKDINNGDGFKKSKRNIIQVELGRYLYMKESSQEVDWERMEILGEGIKRAIVDTGIEFEEKYFNGIS